MMSCEPNLWMDLVPEEWFVWKHTISAHPFCHECDIYGEKQWALHDEYPAIMIDAPWPAFPDKERWIWICHECFFGETDGDFYELDIISEEDYQMELDNIEQNPYGMG